MNRNLALNNIQFTCPELSTYIINTYRRPGSLYVSGHETPLLSDEGVTQGDNSAMALYASSLMPLLRSLMLQSDDNIYKFLKQIWYADDAAAGGKLEDMARWWSMLCKHGPTYGYYPKASKSWIIVKPHYLDEAKRLFPDLNITDIGRKYLGSFIGTEEGKEKYVEDKIEEWANDIEELSKIASREPQVAYAAYIYGLSKRWNYVCRTTPQISHLLKKLEYKIRESFIPALLDRVFSCTDTCRRIFALPAREGGLSIFDISESCDGEYQNSRRMTERLTEAIYNQDRDYCDDMDAIYQIKSEVSTERVAFYKEKRQELYDTLSDLEKLQLDLAAEKGASSWLTALPLKSFGFLLNKQEFSDAVCLRYNLKLKNTATSCACGQSNTINHSLICKKGGYVSFRHNSLCKVTAELLTPLCKDIILEPCLLPTAGVRLPPGSNTADNARCDVSAVSVWNPLERAFLDIRVFHAQAPSNRSHKTTTRMYRHHEALKKTAYNARVMEVEKGVFTPLVFSTTGGMGTEAERFYKRIAEKTAWRTGQKYHETIGYIRKRLRFDLLKTTIIALRGYRGRPSNQPEIAAMDLNLIPEG